MKAIKSITILLIIICLCSCGKKKEESSSTENEVKNYASLSDKDFLINIGSFENVDSPNVIWTFLNNGKGNVNVDGDNDKYEMVWKLKNNKLIITVKWVYEENKEYEIEFDKDNTKFILDGEIVFVKKGSTKKTAVKGDKPSEIKGGWTIMQDNGMYMWYFDDEYCYEGYYVDKLYVINRYTWGVVDGDLVLVSQTLKKEKYGYLVNDDNFVLYRKNEIINNFNKYDGEVLINK